MKDKGVVIMLLDSGTTKVRIEIQK